ncbi:hypothetical protein [Clostridium tyrobutyricum]|jgi:protein-S-isoprenylcysteine O-methyltransferase Ste14|uniref:hypothetical protein n=1 Tax=Clostridium tyrobutyricum TaxID=1519 RepID=UPI000318370F|nr:hypothetical protein [Clostridium tyrobutyricum]MBV4425315.1 hypothetical protein [Clostridium tyrobutyricum]MBV4437512.1 hypothetical protein [Clostridium tyrobutyricum]MBV4441678.1 hypothetical protein [Clostridium tyrobutyricum]
MKILGIIFTILGVLGTFISYHANIGAKLISVTSSLGVLLFGISFLLAYINFVSLNKLDDCRRIYKENKGKVV